MHTKIENRNGNYFSSLSPNRKDIPRKEPGFRSDFAESYFQKNPRVRKIRVRNSGAGNGCANFMDTWKKCLLSAGKTMSVKFPFFGGFYLGGGGGSADFIFMGARIFLRNCHH